MLLDLQKANGEISRPQATEEAEAEAKVEVDVNEQENSMRLCVCVLLSECVLLKRLLASSASAPS